MFNAALSAVKSSAFIFKSSLSFFLESLISDRGIEFDSIDLADYIISNEGFNSKEFKIKSNKNKPF